MHGDIPDVLVAIIMLIALLPWWGGAIVAVIVASVVWAWWRKRQAATYDVRQIANGDTPGTVTITVGENLPGSGGEPQPKHPGKPPGPGNPPRPPPFEVG